MPASPQPRPGILDIAPYVGGKAHSAGASRIIKLSANENALGAAPEAREAFAACAGGLERYPDGGALALRRAIALRHGLDPGRIVCGAGSDELIALLVQAYAGPGAGGSADEVLFCEHGFLMYRLAAMAAGARPVAAPERHLRSDVDALLARVSERTRLVFIANPNNPTGSYLTRDELVHLQAGLPPDVLLVIDAAYAEYVTAADYGDGGELALAHENVVMTRTFSKLHGLAALRLGWMLAPPEVVDVIDRVRGPFNVNAPAQAAGIAALSARDHEERSIAHNERWRSWLHEQLTGLGLTVHPSIANFLLVEFSDAPGRDATAASRALETEGILARAMGAYGLGRALRITVGREEDNRALITALAGFLDRAAAA